MKVVPYISVHWEIEEIINMIVIYIYIYYIIETNFCQLSQLPNYFYCNCHVNYPNSGIMVLHYQLMQKRVSFCPIPLAFGSSGTGKTTALRCALGMMGIVSTRLYCSITKEKIVDLCCSSGIPLGVDDPQSKGDISNLIIKLYNGAGVGLLSRGERELKTSCIIASNFTTLDQQKLVTINFV